MSAAIIPVETGWTWLNVVVYVTSGGAFLGICYLVPRVLKERWLVLREELRYLRGKI